LRLRALRRAGLLTLGWLAAGGGVGLALRTHGELERYP